MSHHIDYEKYKNDERAELLVEMKAKVFNKFLKQPDHNQNCEERQILKASYVVALALAKKCRPYEDGPFVKNLVENVLNCFGQSGKDMALLVETIPFSKISNFLFEDLKKRLQECLFFFICLDDSTDIGNT